LPLQTGTVIGPYEITGWIGAGGMGEVHRARDPRLGREVAIKLIGDAFAADAARVQRFEQEARAVGRLNHPNVLAIYDAGVADGRPYIVSELLEGESLRDRLRAGPVPPRKALDYARQIAEGLAAAHDKSIVHRDLKPDNIFITNDGRIKILDFGLAKLVQPDDGATRTKIDPETQPGTVLGTAGYMAPEQVRGESVDARADLFSFGAILHEMLCGRSPFARSTAVETMAAILNDEPGSVEGTAGPAIDRIVSRCLEKSRESRFQSARDLAFGLEFVSGSSLGSSTQVTAPQLVPSRAWLIGLVASAVLIGAAMTVPPLLRRSPPTVTPPLRMSIDLGSGGALPQVGVQFGDLAALSADGSSIVFVAHAKPDDEAMLFVRSLGELEARPIAGTEGAFLPFFSPDGRWIGFFAERELRKVPIAGGPMQRLATVEDARGGWWGSDGNIVYAPDRFAGATLWRISGDGGTPQPFTTLEAGSQIHVFPQVLPGARAVVYTSSATPGAYNDSNIIVQPLPSGQPKVIQAGGYHGRITASGHLLFIHDGILLAAPIDLDRLEVLSEPKPVVSGVRGNTLTGGAQFTVSESGALAYIPGPSVGGDTPMQLLDRRGNATPIKDRLGNWLDVRFAPDGGRVAMVIRGRTADIWTYDLARESSTRITADTSTHSKPIWSPDGRRLLFATSVGSQPNKIEWRPSDGSGVTATLLQGAKNYVPSAFHPGGQVIVVEEYASEANIDLKAVPIDGTEAQGWKAGVARTIVEGPRNEYDAAFSADGKWIAFAAEDTGHPEIYVMPFPELNSRRQVSNGFGRAPAWSPASSEIVYTNANGQLIAVRYAVRDGVFQAGKPAPWTEPRIAYRGPARMFDIHPDGNRAMVAPAPAPRSSDAAQLDRIVLVLNFFDELRRIVSK
jgi:serine/threonine-protein kinase